MISERRQANAAYAEGTTLDDLQDIADEKMDRNYLRHFNTALEWCTAMRIWLSRSISVGEAKRAHECHASACQEWARMLCHLTPYFHLVMHLIIWILMLGPVYGWWEFPYERFNGFLGRFRHNGHTGGELEATMMRGWLKRQLLHDLVSTPSVFFLPSYDRCYATCISHVQSTRAVERLSTCLNTDGLVIRCKTSKRYQTNARMTSS